MKKERRRYIVSWIVIVIVATVEVDVFVNFAKKLSGVNELILKDIVTIVISVVCSIIASLMFAHFEKEEPINEDSMKKLVEQLGVVERIRYAPTRVYLGTEITHEEFNNNLNRKIEKTKNYYYMGDKAKFLAKRLKSDIKKTNAKLEIDVFVPDIRDELLFSSRLKQLRMDNKHYHAKSDLELIRGEKKDVLKSLYLLKNLGKQYNINIYLHKEIPLYRIEIVDDMLVISLLPALIDGNYYPITFVYENEMQLREAYVDYLEEVRKRSEKILNIELTDEFLVELGKNNIEPCFSMNDLKNCDLVEGRERI